MRDAEWGAGSEKEAVWGGAGTCAAQIDGPF